MGLFGLFVSIVGLGAMAKDGVSRSIHESKARDRAERDGKSFYLTGNGSKINSIETGKQCSISYENGHCILTDTKTGKFIEDVTLKENRQKENDERRTLPSYCVFYRKHDWDYASHHHNIWVSDKIPGFFRFNGIGSDIKPDSTFNQGELVDGTGSRVKEVDTYRFFVNNGKKVIYYANGEPFNAETNTRRENERSKKEAISKGNRFYNFVYRNDKSELLRSEYRDVDTDETYIHISNGDYYTKGYWKEVITEKTIPHHKEKEIIRELCLFECLDNSRFNLDGTEWVP